MVSTNYAVAAFVSQSGRSSAGLGLASCLPLQTAETRFAGKPSAPIPLAPRNTGTELSRALIARKTPPGGSALPTGTDCYTWRNRLYGNALTLQGVWGHLLGLLSTAAFYISLTWIVPQEAMADSFTEGHDMPDGGQAGTDIFSSALNWRMYETTLY